MKRINSDLAAYGVVLLIIISLIVYINVCLEEDTSAPRRALDAAGFTNVNIRTGSTLPYMGCSSSDAVAYDATAVNNLGNKVDVIVCCGIRACTIRFQ